VNTVTIERPVQSRIPLPGTWSLIAVVVAVGMALPVNIAFGEVELAAAIGQAVAVASVFVILPAQFMADTVRPRPGSGMRLAIFTLVLCSILAWAAGVFARGFTLNALLSMLNWVALGGLVLLGQVMLHDDRRLAAVMRGWLTVHAVIGAAVVLYLAVRFGPLLLTSTSRTPFQEAVHDFLPSWPNSYGLTLSVSTCVCFGMIRAGDRGRTLWLLFAGLMGGVMVTFSRNAWLATFCGIVAMLFVTRDRSRSRLAPAIAISLSLVIAAFLPPVRFQIEATFTPGSSQQLSLLERLAFATEAVRVWGDHPWFGIGFARFDEFASLARLSTGLSASADYVPGSVHNEYLSTLVKGGVVSGLSFLLFLFVTFRMFRRLSHAAPGTVQRSWGVVGVGALVALGVGGIGGESFRQVAISAPFWLLAGAGSMLARQTPAAIAPQAEPAA
jgi:O-antigen ligase